MSALFSCARPSHARRVADRDGIAAAAAAAACLQALVDFPGQTRRVVSFKRMALTDFTVEIPRLAKKAVLKKAIEEAGEWKCLCSNAARLGRGASFEGVARVSRCAASSWPTGLIGSRLHAQAAGIGCGSRRLSRLLFSADSAAWQQGGGWSRVDTKQRHDCWTTSMVRGTAAPPGAAAAALSSSSSTCSRVGGSSSSIDIGSSAGRGRRAKFCGAPPM